MTGLTWLLPGLPLAGFVVLAVCGRRLSRRRIAAVGVGSVGVSAVVALAVALAYQSGGYVETLWTWMKAGHFDVRMAFRVDELSIVMSLVVTFVGFLIHLYASESMAEEEGYRRFFAYMNLFLASMLILVLADDLLLLYLGWEGVGLCSYLLIGFWYRDPANGRAARKAFIVTRIGDAAMAVGLFILFTRLGTLEMPELMRRASAQWAEDSSLAITASALLLAGAVGKSAQLPLQTWLPDAMAGPTPVSALIHAATMVTAGVYLIVRMHGLFALAPSVLAVVGLIGAVTLLLAAASALVERDIKRILAYSTMSQIGYMFLALGAGAWTAAVFHFVTHAFFKALLFLAAGVVITACHEEHDIFKMGGLRKTLPVTFWCFLAGAAALAGIPLVTAGFYSKDWILSEVWAVSPALWAAGWLGAVLTALYSFRLVLLVFFGEPKQHVTYRPRGRILWPLGVLAALSLLAGFLQIPRTLGDVPAFSDWMSRLWTQPGEHVALGREAVLEGVVGVASLGGVFLAYLLFGRRTGGVEWWMRAPLAARLHRWAGAGWGFDRLYDRVLVRPFVRLARAGARDVIDDAWMAVASTGRAAHLALSRTQSGRLRWYAGVLAAGTLLSVGVVLFS